MSTTLLVARLLLAGVFAVAGVAKLIDRRGSRQAIIGFGLPAALASPLGLLLPLAELAVAVALIPTASAWWGALGALALLLIFVVGLGLNLAQGKKPDCHCFGQLHSAPAGWKTLSRNGVLAALAGVLVWGGWEGDLGPSAIAWIGALSTFQLLALIVGVVVVALLASQWWFLANLMRQNVRLLVRLEALEKGLGADGVVPSQNGAPAQPQEGLPVGTQAPAFSLEAIHGETLTLDSLRSSGKPVMLLFTDPGCGPCNALLPELGRWQEEYSEKLSTALLSRGTIDENKAKISEHGLTRVLLQKDWEVSEAYGVRGTPSALVVRPDGTIGSPVAEGAEAIRSLVQRAVEAPSPNAPLMPGAPAPAHNGNGGPCPNCGKRHPTEGAPAMPQTLKVGEEAPEVKLEDLSGKKIDLKENFKGRANGSLSRRRALNAMGAAVMGGVLASIPGVAFAKQPTNPGGSRACPEGQRKECKCVCTNTCASPKVPNPTTCACECPTSFTCPSPQVLNPNTCACECPTNIPCELGTVNPNTCQCECTSGTRCPGGKCCPVGCTLCVNGTCFCP